MHFIMICSTNARITVSSSHAALQGAQSSSALLGQLRLGRALPGDCCWTAAEQWTSSMDQARPDSRPHSPGSKQMAAKMIVNGSPSDRAYCSCVVFAGSALTPAARIRAVLDYNATFINDLGVALLDDLTGSAAAGSSGLGTFVSPVSVMLALALLLNGAAPGSATFWCGLCSQSASPAALADIRATHVEGCALVFRSRPVHWR